MAYKTVRADRKVQKAAHLLLHLAAICLGFVGIHAAFKYHDRRNLRHMYSFHSWIGIAIICLYILQVYIGTQNTYYTLYSLLFLLFRNLIFLIIYSSVKPLNEFLKSPSNIWTSSNFMIQCKIFLVLCQIFRDISSK